MTYASTIVASILLRSIISTAAGYLPATVLERISARTFGYILTQVGTGIISYYALKKNWGKQSEL